MSYARSPLEVCSTTMGTRTEASMNSSSAANDRGRDLCSSGDSGPLGFSMFGQVLTRRLECLRQLGDRDATQIIHDTRTQRDPAIVHGAGHHVGAFGQTAGTLLV